MLNGFDVNHQKLIKKYLTVLLFRNVLLLKTEAASLTNIRSACLTQHTLKKRTSEYRLMIKHKADPNSN